MTGLNGITGITGFIVPVIIFIVLGAGIFKKVDIFSTFVEGASEGLKTGVKILPALIILMTCVGMFKASGGLDMVVYALSPIAELLHIPSEVVPLALLRPLSGSGALVMFEDILKDSGADSLIGKTAAVMMGSTETTFYTIAVYCGALNIKKSRHTIPSALAGDLTGFMMSAALVALLL